MISAFEMAVSQWFINHTVRNFNFCRIKLVLTRGSYIHHFRVPSLLYCRTEKSTKDNKQQLNEVKMPPPPPPPPPPKKKKKKQTKNYCLKDIAVLFIKLQCLSQITQMIIWCEGLYFV